jgi:hypothetical protein
MGLNRIKESLGEEESSSGLKITLERVTLLVGKIWRVFFFLALKLVSIAAITRLTASAIRHKQTPFMYDRGGKVCCTLAQPR